MVTRIGPRQPRRNYLAEWRKLRQLTQEQLAERLGTSKPQVSNWENARRMMTYQVQAALAEALNIEPGDLFRHPDTPSVDALLRDQSPEVVRQAVDMIEVLIRKRG